MYPFSEENILHRNPPRMAAITVFVWSGLIFADPQPARTEVSPPNSAGVKAGIDAPEPSVDLLIGAGLIAAAVFARIRRKAKAV